ncbi:hypothetical protein BKA64DRAFT_655409 [Cadophora sp. MPI-SDFR-AT-0126]|nr:hypothetical protein BKA64DRAFT_655409 [Leotiomycetes sp. MPI-SDFR-AT-0126]
MVTIVTAACGSIILYKGSFMSSSMHDLTEILPCLCGCKTRALRGPGPGVPPPLVEKPPQPTPRLSIAVPPHDRATIVADVISILCTAEERGIWLAWQLQNAVGAEGWTDWIAQQVLAGLEVALKEGREKMGPAMAEAFDSASEAADKVFHSAKDHPKATAGWLAILAVGVLFKLTPVPIEALGFTELGAVEGSFAAWWRARTRTLRRSKRSVLQKRPRK